MNLYQYKHAVSAVPAENAAEARNEYKQEVIDDYIDKKDFVVIVPHEDFIKIFRLARTLYAIDQYTAENVQALVEAYTKHLGYNLSESDLWHGILKWAERFIDVDDEDIEEWMN